MPKQETLQEFAKNLPRFSLIIQKNILKDWQNYTEESFARSQELVPILSGDLLRSGMMRKAKITSKGIESFIEYTMPYSSYIHGGKNADGSDIDYKLETYEYPDGQTKARQGEAGFLTKPVEKFKKDVIDDIFKSIGKAWNKI